MHLYIHIPFCRQACYYCDFHFSTNLSAKKDMSEAIALEIGLRAGYLSSQTLDTIYFGGGTPSLLEPEEIASIFKAIESAFEIGANPEITLEANPDDISTAHLKSWKSFGINRLSIGVQTFDSQHLNYLNRIHTAHEAEKSIKMAQDHGFENLSLDLIYGIHEEKNIQDIPERHDVWRKDLQKIISFQTPHISSYCLTIEEKTVFGKWQKSSKIPAVDDEFASEQFRILTQTLSENGYQHYEISNFACNGQYSRHNTSYWQGHEYLGVGPAAHSFNGTSRQYNVSNNGLYLKGLQNGKIPFEIEHLSPADQVNDYILTGLRTIWGINLNEIEKKAGGEDLLEFYSVKDKYLDSGHLILEDRTLKLTAEGLLFADGIASELFI